MDVLVLIDKLDQLVHEAKAVPLTALHTRIRSKFLCSLSPRNAITANALRPICIAA